MTKEVYINAIRSQLRAPTIYLKRSVRDVRVNNYNAYMLMAWQANFDNQFILDTYACVAYVAAYVTKSFKGISEILRHANDEVQQGNLDLKKQMSLIGNKFLNWVEISVQEAVYICLKLHMK